MTSVLEAEQLRRDALEAMSDALIASLLSAHLEVTEGTVMTVGPPPYRRLDCDGRALAYVRVRPRKQCLRVDISGLWVLPPPCAICVRAASGPTSLLLRTEADIRAAAQYLSDAVLKTRALERRGARTDQSVYHPGVSPAADWAAP